MNAQLPETAEKFHHRINTTLLISGIDQTPEGLAASLIGHLKHDATDPLHAFFSEQLRTRQTCHLLLDCAGLSFVDSQGLALLLMLHRLCQSQNGALIIKAPPKTLRDLLRLTRFDSVIKVLDQ